MQYPNNPKMVKNMQNNQKQKRCMLETHKKRLDTVTKQI